MCSGGLLRVIQNYEKYTIFTRKKAEFEYWVEYHRVLNGSILGQGLCINIHSG